MMLIDKIDLLKLCSVVLCFGLNHVRCSDSSSSDVPLILLSRISQSTRALVSLHHQWSCTP